MVKTRKTFLTTIDPNIFAELKATKKRTGVPASRQVDQALENYFKELRKRAGV